jgi:hypothetical protein
MCPVCLKAIEVEEVFLQGCREDEGGIKIGLSEFGKEISSVGTTLAPRPLTSPPSRIKFKAKK